MSSALSISDSVSVEDQGRSFQGYKEGKYVLPNDGAGYATHHELDMSTYAKRGIQHEQDRLDFLHALWLLLMKGALSWAPISRAPARVLDLGTGTGIWANQFAEKHPETEVIGIDLSLIQPPADRTPPNCKFFRKDAEEPWNFDSVSDVRKFDLIHLRNMSFHLADPKAVMGKVFQNLAPGGWIEFQEWSLWGLVGADNSMDERLRHSAMMRSQEMLAEGAARIGCDAKLVPRLKEWLDDRRCRGETNLVPQQPMTLESGRQVDREAYAEKCA
ncbi:hypothetical protein PG996_005534 [Apiospora saccharicola]|uniref:Methyltransferase domain-containing protein n=1 Tax=Apiospora saccharicola TaxID=335842 RepID=A0ABR1VPE6_9PEZI